MATISARKVAGVARSVVEIAVGMANMALARTAPPIAPTTWAGTYTAERAGAQTGVGAAAEEGVGERDHGVEVRARDRGEQQDEHPEAQRSGDGVLEQLQPGVGGEALRGDA